MSEDKSNAEDKKKTVDLGLLEEDDEFEEFPAEEWEKKDEDAGDVNVWEDNWDDDNVEDDFAVQLSKFGRKRSRGGTRSPPLRSPEPMAKRACLSPGMGGVSPSPTKQIRMSSNGHASSNGNGHSSTPSPPTSRREPSRATESPSRSTRSSARLRTPRK